jgi:hypothetical protein
MTTISTEQSNTIKNCPVTTEDVNNGKKIFGADMSSLKGKSTHCLQVYLGKGRLY